MIDPDYVAGANSRQEVIAERIVELIQGLAIDFIESDDIRVESYADGMDPGRGVIVSPLRERELPGLNTADDIAYPFLVMYSESGLNTQLNVSIKSRFRQSIFNAFNRVRIGLSADLNVCELVTTCSFGDLESQREWKRQNRDNNIMIVTVVVRVVR